MHSLQFVLVLVGALVFGVWGYQASEQFRAKTGRTPWSLPSILWGLTAFFSVALGALLLAVARRTTRPASTS